MVCDSLAHGIQYQSGESSAQRVREGYINHLLPHIFYIVHNIFNIISAPFICLVILNIISAIITLIPSSVFPLSIIQ